MKSALPVGCKGREKGLTAIELGCCLGIVVSAFSGFALGRHYFGWWGGLAGFILLPVTLQGFLFLILILQEWIFGCIPLLPVCQRGCCRRKDYELKTGSLHQDWYWQCKCGTRYRKLGKGNRRFMLVNDDNSHTPYMRYVPCIGWRKDKGPGTGPCW
jgi:hypothetical protein